MITERQYRALRILFEHRGGIKPRDFGELMWPESLAKERSYNIGNGATKGVGLWLAAGSYLAKLMKLGLVTHCRDGSYRTISTKGLKAMDDFRHSE